MKNPKFDAVRVFICVKYSCGVLLN